MSMAALVFGLKFKYWKVLEIIVRDRWYLKQMYFVSIQNVQLEGNISIAQNAMCPIGDIPAWTITHTVTRADIHSLSHSDSILSTKSVADGKIWDKMSVWK